MLRSRRFLPAAATALAAVLLTAGCSSAQSGTTPSTSASAGSAAPAATTAPSATSTPIAQVSAGSASNAVKVTDKGRGKEPGVTFPVPTTVTSTQRTTVTAGTGDTVAQGDKVGVSYAIYDAKTGKKLDASGYGSSSATVFPIDATQLLPGLVQALNGTKEGERFAAVIPAAQAFGTTGSEQLGVGGGDSLVLVADVGDITPTKASGTAKALPSGFPKVTLAADGQPTVSIPATDPPKTLKIATSQVGDGETVQDGDTVTVQYQGVLWRTGKVFDQSWTKSGATSFATNQVVKGFGTALVGAKVGSQVVAIIPPSDGYGANPPSGSGITKTDTMVFVVDVLATARAS